MPNQRKSRAVRATSLFGILLLAVMSLSLWLYWRVTEEVVWKQNPVTAAALVDQLLLQVHWEGLETDKDFGKAMEDLVTDFAGKLGESGVEATFLYRPEALQYPDSGPGHTANQFETDLMAQFMRPRAEGAEESVSVDTSSFGNERYFYYEPIYAERTCTGACHLAAPPGGVFETDTASKALLRVGDLMAVAKISLPNHELCETVNRTWNLLLGATIITALLVMIAFYIVVRSVSARTAG